MAIHWKLKTYLSKKLYIHRIVDLKKLIIKRTGIVISNQNLSNLVNKKPQQINLETMEIICSALDCKLSDFLEVKNKKFKLTGENRQLSYKNTPNSKKRFLNFPDPQDYF